MKTLLAAALLAAALASRPAAAKAPAAAAGAERKIAMLIMDPPTLPWASGRLLTALVFAGQLQKAGVKVQLVFYSFGVQWLAILEDLPSAQETEEARRRASQGTSGFYREYLGKNVLVQKYQDLRKAGLPVALCVGSADRSGLSKELKERKVPLVEVQSDAKGEMSIVPLVMEGYQLWSF